MKLFINYFILWVFSPFIVMAQTKGSISRVDSVKEIFIQLYNQGNSHAIYNMCDTSFQQYLQHYNFSQWFHQARQDLGECRQTIKTKQSNETAVYKAYFQNDKIALVLAIDRAGKIRGLEFKPLPESPKKYVVQSNNPLKNPIDSLVDKVIKPYIQQENTVGVSIGVIDRGEFYTYGYGETVKGDHQLPNENTIYEIGSITKTFTATLLAEMVLQGKCNLNDPVSKYLPKASKQLQKNGIPVTLEMLATHTSGLPREASDLLKIPGDSFRDPYNNYDDQSLFNYLDSVRLRSIPGIHFTYSNLGYGLLGTILERINGLSYQQLLEKYIGNPLYLKDTRTILDDEQKKRLAQGYNKNGESTPHFHFKSMTGCGAIRSSVKDMLKYLDAHFSTGRSTDLSRAFRLCELQSFPALGGYIGLAWYTLRGYPGWYWHNGGTGGFRSYCAYNPKKQTAIVILSNSALSVDEAGAGLVSSLSAQIDQ